MALSRPKRSSVTYRFRVGLIVFTYDVPVRLGSLLVIESVLNYDPKTNTVAPVQPPSATSFMEPLLRKSNYVTDLVQPLQKARTR